MTKKVKTVKTTKTKTPKTTKNTKKTSKTTKTVKTNNTTTSSSNSSNKSKTPFLIKDVDAMQNKTPATFRVSKTRLTDTDYYFKRYIFLNEFKQLFNELKTMNSINTEINVYSKYKSISEPVGLPVNLRIYEGNNGEKWIGIGCKEFRGTHLNRLLKAAGVTFAKAKGAAA